MFGLEGTTLPRRAPGSGQTAVPGNSHCGTEDNQTMSGETRTDGGSWEHEDTGTKLATM